MKLLTPILAIALMNMSCMRIGSNFKAVNSDLYESAAIQGAKTQDLRFELADVKDMDYFLEILEREPRSGQFIYRGAPKKEPLPEHPIDAYNSLVKKGFFLQKGPSELARRLDFYFLPEEYKFIVSLSKELRDSGNTETLNKVTEMLEKEYAYYLNRVVDSEYPTVVQMFKSKDKESLMLKARLNLLHADLVGAAKRLGALRIIQMPYIL